MKKINNKYRNNNYNNQVYSLNYKFDSTSPAGKVTGTALDLIKKYNDLAKDSMSNNDYVTAEVYRQYAEHYRKIVTEINEKKMQRNNFNHEAENVVETELENDQLSQMFIKIKELKKQGYPIRNSYYFMDYIINKKTYYECHWPRIATVIYSNGEMLRCYDRKPFISVRNRPLKDVIKDPLFIETVNKCKDCKLACVGNYALDASGLWKLEWPAIKSLMEIAIT